MLPIREFPGRHLRGVWVRGGRPRPSVQRPPTSAAYSAAALEHGGIRVSCPNQPSAVSHTSLPEICSRCCPGGPHQRSRFGGSAGRSRNRRVITVKCHRFAGGKLAFDHSRISTSQRGTCSAARRIRSSPCVFRKRKAPCLSSSGRKVGFAQNKLDCKGSRRRSQSS